MDACSDCPCPEVPSTQYLRPLVPNSIKGMSFGTRAVKCWLLGTSGHEDDGQTGQTVQPPSTGLSTGPATLAVSMDPKINGRTVGGIEAVIVLTLIFLK